jgi:DNA-binding response OmpR family regulator
VAGARRVLVLADDLIWSDRLSRAVTAAGAEPVRVATLEAFVAAIETGPSDAAAIVDLTSRAYDGLAAIEAAAAGGRRILAVGQQDDHDLRKRALAAGAQRVLAYQKLFQDGPATIERFLTAPAHA